MAYTIKVRKANVAYRLDECRWKGTEHDDEDHQCESECTWMDGDRREIGFGSEGEYEPDAYDLEEYGSPVEWAVRTIRKDYPDVVNAPQMLNGTAQENQWIDGSYEDPYKGDLDVTETSIWLVGDWTETERAEVFRRATLSS
jgi:hypothetical protein